MRSTISTVVLLTCILGQTLAICDNKEGAVEDILNHYNRLPVSSSLPKPSANKQTRHNLPTDEILKAEGYPVETHYVTTPDGYILTLHRIPHGKTNSMQRDRPVVFIQHGLLASSADWVVSTPAKGLGYILADAGYDVWMGNYRGNTYSRNHTFFNPDEGTGGFWDFTWDEMAHFDIPSQIEKVLKVTGKNDLQYIGHSMGSTGFMAMHHYRKDIAAKIRLAHMLAPVIYVKHMESPIAWIASLGGYLDYILSWFGIGEFMPSNLLMDCIASLFCHEGSVYQNIFCSNIIFLLCGYDEPQVNTTLLETIIHHCPAGGSTNTILHYAQEVVSGGFHGFDWGNALDNFHHHGGSGAIPTYSLDDVTTPLAIYWGQNDWLAAEEDVQQTISELPNIVPGMLHMVEFPLWNHLDFLWAIDADKYVYKTLVENLALGQAADYRDTAGAGSSS